MPRLKKYGITGHHPRASLDGIMLLMTGLHPGQSMICGKVANSAYRMEARDGSKGFDFEGIYDNVIVNKQIDYTLGDGRKVKITFSSDGKTTDVIETFEAEPVNPVEMQRNGWQSIVDNFKKYAESN